MVTAKEVIFKSQKASKSSHGILPGFIVGMVLVPITAALLPIWFDNEAKIKKIEAGQELILELRDMNDSLAAQKAELEREKENFSKEIESVRLDLDASTRMLDQLYSEKEDLEVELSEIIQKNSRLERMFRLRSASIINQISVCPGSVGSVVRIGHQRVSRTEDYLDLRRTAVPEPSMALIGCLTNLRTLRMKEINATSLESIGFLSDLRHLEISNSQIESLDFLFGLDRLIHLDLSDSSVLDLAGAQHAQALVRLNLSGVSVIYGAKSISALQELKHLNLSDASGVPLTVLRDLSKLETLWLGSLGNTVLRDFVPPVNLHSVILPSGRMVGGVENNQSNREAVQDFFLGRE